jgi:hypothetical protein
MPELCSNSLKWNYIIMLRNLLASAIILAASSSAFAIDASPIEGGAVVDGAIVVDAENSAELAQLLLAANGDMDAFAKAAIAEGFSVADIITTAVKSGQDASTVVTATTTAAISAGQPVATVLAQTQSIEGISADVALVAASTGALNAGVSEDALQTAVVNVIADGAPATAADATAAAAIVAAAKDSPAATVPAGSISSAA